MKSLRILLGLPAILLAAFPFSAAGLMALQGKSVTVLPLRLEVEARPTDGEIAVRMAEVVGLMLENAGMGEVEVAEAGWVPAEAEYAEAFGRRVREQPPSTDTALWVRFAGVRSLERIDWVLCARDGKVLAQSAAPGEPAPGDPMQACLAVARALQAGSDLGDPTRQPATEGTMARRMRERSGLPSPAELEEAKARLAGLGGTLGAGCAVYPVRVAGPDEADAAVARLLAERLDAAGLGPATAVPIPDMTLEVPGDPNQMRVLWDTARAFRSWLQAHPPASQPYALLVECGPVPEVRYVHVFLCERNGDWVVVDMQNNHHDDFQRVAPDSVEGCLDLAVQRLQSRIRSAAAPPQKDLR